MAKVIVALRQAGVTAPLIGTSSLYSDALLQDKAFKAAAQGMIVGTFQYSRGPGVLVAVLFDAAILATCMLGAWGMRTGTGIRSPCRASCGSTPRS